MRLLPILYSYFTVALLFYIAKPAWLTTPHHMFILTILYSLQNKTKQNKSSHHLAGNPLQWMSQRQVPWYGCHGDMSQNSSH